MKYNYRNVSAVQFVKNVKYHWTVENVADFLEKRLPHLDFSVDTWSYQRKTALELLVGDKTRHSSRDKLVMCLLLKHGANPLKCRSRETIMQRILRHKDSALIINFLMFVKDINSFHGGSTALHIAVSRRLKDVVEYIISRNELNINMRTNGKWTSLHEATKAGRLDIIKTLLDNGADVEARDEAGQTPLHWAVRFRSSMDLVKTLVESGADVNSKDEYGCTPLHILCTKGAGVNMDIFDLLLQKMDNPNTEDSKGSTPIHNLMRLLPVNSLPRNKKLIELFLKYGGSLNKEDGLFGTVLHVAACSNHSANFLMFLMEKGANAYILNGANLTFLDYIIRSDRKKVKEIVKNMIVQEFKGRSDLDPLLLNCVRTDREINEYVPNSVDISPLYPLEVYLEIKAIYMLFFPEYVLRKSINEFSLNIMKYNYRNVSAVQFVKNVKYHWTVENVADFLENRLPHLDFSVDTWSYQRKTALELLVGDKTRHSSRDKLVMCLLLKHGANPLKCRSRETIMQRILRHKDSALIINFLMFVKDINSFHGGSTALHIAVSRRLKDVVEYIISRNELNINMRTNGKWTALHEATKAGRLDIIKTLLDNGADVEARDEAGQTPLHWAVRFHSSMDLVKTLVESGADVNSKDEYGCTPLHILCTKGAGVNMDIFDLLLQKMDNPNTEDSKGSTPMHNLMRLLPVNSLPRNKKLVELFLKYGGSLNKEDGLFGTVLHVAACSNHSANFLMFLMEKGAYACILNGANLTFLDYIIRSDRKKVKEIVKNMIVHEFKGRFDLDPLLLNCVRTDREINEYVRSCRIELCLLTGRQLGNEKQVSLFTVLSSDERTLANIFRNALTRNEMVKFHRRKFPMFKKKIPIYGRNLIDNYKLGLKRMQSENIFHDFLTRIVIQLTTYKLTVKRRKEIMKDLLPKVRENWNRMTGHIRGVEKFTMLELEDAIKSLKSGKAPGPDGLTVEEFKVAFQIVPDDLLGMYNSSKGVEESMSSLNIMKYNYRNVSAVQFVKNVKYHWTVENVADFLENRLPHLDFSVDTWSYQRKTALELLVGDKTRHSSRDKLVMCLLLKHGANPLKCRSRETIMQRILRHKDSALIINFLMFVKDINSFHGGSTALHIAVSRRLKDVVEYIISRNELNINMRTNGKWTALHEATKVGRLDIIKTLLDNGADVEARDEAGQTPLHWAVRFHSSMDLVKTLVESGADVNSKDEYGCTPLHILCTKGAGVNMDIFDLLLQKMDNPNTEDSKGSTPIHILMRLLPVNSLPRNKKLVELFLKYGGSLNKEDGIFGTVLHVAACSNHSANFLMFLMEKGAYACILNGANLTFLDYIIRSDRKKVKEIVKNMIVQEFKGRFDLDPLLLNCVRTDREINQYVRSCKIELCLLTGRQLGNEKQVSLFTVLSSDERTLANIFRNALTRNEMVKFHRRKFPMFKKKIPIYGRNLIDNYKLGLKRMQSENIFHDFLTRIGGNDLSIYSVEEIVRLCPTEEMIKLKPI
ncbi:uncharacterized protein LOC123321090 [Coccinella septempunctata]|uniref:uncharacterized protein LOC123321090 n=2 Tax=Coccinella septempunctata TaxID=41139 RepID=UPI001D06029C|nr:uncharacterized protein LOC123321090 [Coccinella septempunctata]